MSANVKGVTQTQQAAKKPKQNTCTLSALHQTADRARLQVAGEHGEVFNR